MNNTQADKDKEGPLLKAVFLDRDGTLIIDKHYMHRVEDIEYFPDSLEALKMMQDKNYRLFVVTNQSGVARGLFPETDILKIHKAMELTLFENGLKPYVDLAYSPHSAESSSPYRKPGPQMILDLCQKWRVDKKKSFMIGDKLTDAMAGKNAGVQGVLLGEKFSQNKDFPSFLSLREFASFLP